MIYLMTAPGVERVINAGDVAESIEKELAARVRRVSFDLTPEVFYDAARRQYHSTRILKELLQTFPADASKAIGIVPFDLFIPILTFVFGEAQLDGKVGIVSTARLEQPFYGMPPNVPLLHRRLIKEIKHELGHTFGLLHCPDRSCVMSLAGNVTDVDRKGLTFCRGCKERVRAARDAAPDAERQRPEGVE